MDFNRTVVANGITFACIEAGDGPLVLLLHGFPDTAKSWDRTILCLAEQGFRAVAPNLRGYPPTGFAADNDYQPKRLGEDVLALIEAFGEQQAIVVGYDWGAAAAYAAAMLAPEKLSKLVTVGVIHPGVQNFGLSFFWRNRHIPFFQFVRASGYGLQRNNFQYVDTLYRRWAPAWDRPVDETFAIKQMYRDFPESVQSTTAYYRAAARSALDKENGRLFRKKIDTPTLCFAGNRDGCMPLEGFEKHRRLFTGSYHCEIVEEAGHFLHREKQEVFHRVLLKFLQSG